MRNQGLNSVLGKIALSYTFCVTFKKTVSNGQRIGEEDLFFHPCSEDEDGQIGSSLEIEGKN